MKKLVTALTLMAGVGMSFGQAVIHNPSAIQFQNTETTRPAGKPATFHNITNSATGLGLVGTQYSAELYYLDTATSSLIPVPATLSSFKSTTTSTGLGTWNGPGTATALPTTIGGVDIFDDGSGEALQDAPGHTSANGDGYYPITLAVRVWDSTTGSTYETASIRGSSANFSYLQRFAQGVPGGSPSQLDTQMVNQSGFTLQVPEPSAIALSVMGVAGLLFIRRRKS